MNWTLGSKIIVKEGIKISTRECMKKRQNDKEKKLKSYLVVRRTRRNEKETCSVK